MKLIFDFVGSHSTGKTTIMEMLRNELFKNNPQVQIVTSITRDTLMEEYGVQLYDETTDYQQVMISWLNWSNILQSEAEVVLCTDYFVRSAAYTYASKETSYKIKLRHAKYVGLFSSSGFISTIVPFWFYLPIEFPAEPDGLRKMDDCYRTLVDDYIIKIIKRYKLPYRTLSGPVDIRYACAKDAITRVLQLYGKEHLL